LNQEIKKAIRLLKAGELVAIPTETVYGLAANGLDGLAVAKIFEAKDRPSFDPLILHIGRMEQVVELTTSFPEKAQKLAAKFWPGPLTLILPKSDIVPDVISSGLPSVGIRMPKHPMTLELLRSLSFPLAAPSANPFGYVSPTTAQHVKDQLEDKIAFVLDGGPCEIGLESTIVSFLEQTPTILRHGGIAQKEIEAIIGPIEAQTQSTSSPSAPGMLISHYAPNKKVILGNIEKLISAYPNEKVAVLGFKSTYGMAGEILSAQGDLLEAAQNLFAAMRRLDQTDCEYIFTEKVPHEGIGIAINDKLKRASEV
jgi:L-threonylcarbamoyladenylate synthase